MGAYRGCNPPIQTVDPNDINFSRSGPGEIPEPIVVVWKVGRPIAHNARHVSNEKYGPLVVFGYIGHYTARCGETEG